jgi:UDP-N-acetyl-D-galactosamine dehydrogenase
MQNDNNIRVAVIGLGYVGLPLAVAFAHKYQVIGFDINVTRVESLQEGNDNTLEVSAEELKTVLIKHEGRIQNKNGLVVTCDSSLLKGANFFIITVPTPIDKHNRPVLVPMIKASETVASFLKKGDVVIYESTVYPGVTEEEMVPVLEKISNLKFNIDFFCGYSPERINPGDKQHTVTNILKITSGSTPEAAELIDKLYKSVITAGTFKASSIRIAEAAKVIENAQRDINIAFVNELAQIFNKLGIDTQEVLNAASTKWNFLKFTPGLVGGHCIGVDPYYLAQKAQELGHHPEIILAGRRLNDSMGRYVAEEAIKHLLLKKSNVSKSKFLILGITFKENCPDIRNSKVIDIYNRLKDFGFSVDISDPFASSEDVSKEYGVKLLNEPDLFSYSSIIVAVGHTKFKDLPFKEIVRSGVNVYDVKGILGSGEFTFRL